MGWQAQRLHANMGFGGWEFTVQEGNFVGFFDLILMHVAIIVIWMVGYLGILMGLELGFEVNYGYTLVVIFG